jgi:hypothetical protein
MTQWLATQFLRASARGTIECMRAIGDADFRADLRAFTIPTLIVHGDAHNLNPLDKTGRKTAAAIRGSELKVYEGGPHGVTITTGTASPRTCSRSSAADREPVERGDPHGQVGLTDSIQPIGTDIWHAQGRPMRMPAAWPCPSRRPSFACPIDHGHLLADRLRRRRSRRDPFDAG